MPETLTLKHNRDLEGTEHRPWTRRVLLTLLLALLVAALFNVFGQRPSTSTAAGPVASLEVYSPGQLRGGLFYMGRFTIRARRDVKKAILVLDSGWFESMQINTIEPSPISEASRNGRVALDFGHIPAGQKLVAFIEFEVNPTNVGHRAEDVDLYDGKTRIVHVERSVTIFP